MKQYEPDNSGFFYMAGLCLGRHYGNAPIEFKQKVVSKFKDWVTAKAGPADLPTSKYQVNEVVKQFLFEFNRGEIRGKRH